MAESSVSSTAEYNGVASAALRSVSFSSDGRTVIDASCLGDDFQGAVVGVNQQVTATVVTLDEPSTWIKPSLNDDTGHDLVLDFGAAPHATRTFKNAVVVDCSMTVGLDAVIEFTWTFATISDPI